MGKQDVTPALPRLGRQRNPRVRRSDGTPSQKGVRGHGGASSDVGSIATLRGLRVPFPLTRRCRVCRRVVVENAGSQGAGSPLCCGSSPRVLESSSPRVLESSSRSGVLLLV